MTIGAKQHPADKLADWAAPAVLAVAGAWSAWKVVGTQAGGLAAGVFALALGVLAMRLLGQPRPREIGVVFEPLTFDEAAGSDELLLDDPLVEVEADSRVVRLFERAEATPGEMVARIEDYLGEGRRRLAVPPEEERSAAPPDASAALHAALANIRASLR
jgi:hypothetical protein